MRQDDKMTFNEVHEELVQTLPDGYFSGLQEKKFELKAKDVKPMKVKKHKRNKKKGW